MKSRLIDRILLRFFLMCAVVFGLAAMLYALRIPWVVNFVRYGLLQESYTNYMWLAGALLFAVLLALYLLAAPDRKPPDAVALQMEGGNKLRITFSALEQIARQYALQYTEIEHAGFRFTNDKAGLKLLIRLGFRPETVIPDVTARFTEGITAHIAGHCGIRIAGVELFVEPQKTGV